MGGPDTRPRDEPGSIKVEISEVDRRPVVPSIPAADDPEVLRLAAETAERDARVRALTLCGQPNFCKPQYN